MRDAITLGVQERGLSICVKKVGSSFGNLGWMESWEFLNPRVTDNSLPMISKEMEGNFGQKLLKFYFYVDKDSFLNCIQKGWAHEIDRVHIFRLYAKLKAIKCILRKVNIELFGGIP